MIDTIESVESLIKAGLACPLPGADGQMRMAADYRAEPGMLSVTGKTCREAGVLLLLLPVGRVPHILLTVRNQALSNHAGQVSLPGGRREKDESLLGAALRETQEEVGIPVSQIRVLGPLSPLYIPPSRYCVYPFVGTCTEVALRPDAREVDRLVMAPLAELLDPDVRRISKRVIGGTKRDVPFFELAGETVWGATAMILSELAAIIDYGIQASDATEQGPDYRQK